MRLEYIFKDDVDMNDPIIRKLQEYCDMMKILFEVREFDSIEHDHDRHYITKLPAIHIYKKGYYDTIYPDEKPIQIIQLLHNKFDLEELEYLSKTQIWDEKLKHLRRVFRKQSLKTDSYTFKNTV